MNIQHESASFRKYIPTFAYFQLQENQRSKSYIGMSLSHAEEAGIRRRIRSLEALEKDGFVYVGEKCWLKFYLENNRSNHFESYDRWISHHFENFLHLDFQISPGRDGPTTVKRKAELDTDGLMLDFSDLRNPAFFPVDDLEIMIGGDMEGMSPVFMVKTFEFLHNLEYALSTVTYKPPGDNKVSVTGIDVSNPVDPSRWELNVMSEYGSEWDITIINGVAWG